jgi:hypothetical protein
MRSSESLPRFSAFIVTGIAMSFFPPGVTVWQ